MISRRCLLVTALALTGFVHGATHGEPGRPLVVCADPANLPFSNDKGDGFENRIADVVARDLGVTVRYRWGPSWRGAFLRALRKGECDVVMGATAGLAGVAVTRPLFTSTYVFVSRREQHLHLGDFDDPVLRSLRIGLHTVAAGGSNSPAASALTQRGLAGNVVGFPMWGSDSDTQGRIVDAVASGEIDAAIVWGPIAGYYAKRYADQLDVSPASDRSGRTATPFVYEISLGVREGDDGLRKALDGAIERHRAEIQQILGGYGTPPAQPMSVDASSSSDGDAARADSNIATQEH